MRFRAAAACASVFLASSAYAQSAMPNVPNAVDLQSPPAGIAPATCCAIPALTDITLTIDKTINSQANHAGESFPITLALPLEIGGKTLLPAGATGFGEIVHAAKSRFGGRAGELILAVRYLEHGGVRVPLRSLRYIEGRGKDRGDTAAAISMASAAVAPIGAVISMFITGGEVTIPAGTFAKAKTAVAVTVPGGSFPGESGTAPTDSLNLRKGTNP